MTYQPPFDTVLTSIIINLNINLQAPEFSFKF